MNIDYKIEHLYGSIKLDSWITKEGIGMCRKTTYDKYGNVVECKQEPTGFVVKNSEAWKEPKKKINWMRIFVAVNFIANLYILYCIRELYQLSGDIGSALVFMSKVFEYVYHAGRVYI
jgi:hypothetical protein